MNNTNTPETLSVNDVRLLSGQIATALALDTGLELVDIPLSLLVLDAEAWTLRTARDLRDRSAAVQDGAAASAAEALDAYVEGCHAYLDGVRPTVVYPPLRGRQHLGPRVVSPRGFRAYCGRLRKESLDAAEMEDVRALVWPARRAIYLAVDYEPALDHAAPGIEVRRVEVDELFRLIAESRAEAWS